VEPLLGRHDARLALGEPQRELDERRRLRAAGLDPERIAALRGRILGVLLDQRTGRVRLRPELREQLLREVRGGLPVAALPRDQRVPD
jgi:hypothetical protein